jgi:hypothetical protein
MKWFYFIVGIWLGAVSAAIGKIVASRVDYTAQLVDPYDIFTDEEGTDEPTFDAEASLRNAQ